jgi:Peptidase U49
MLCDNYVNGLEEQPGNQPIRVFGLHFKDAFDNVKIELSSPPLSFNNLDLLQFKLLIEDKKAIGPFSTEDIIQIHDTFLSFLWSYCYGLLITAPMGGKELTTVEDSEARELLKYALKLLSDYETWDKEALPNPELHGKDEKRLIGATNACFWYGYNYILYHEFAHIVLGHCERTNRAHSAGYVIQDDEHIEMEREADQFALDRVMEKVNGTSHDFSAIIGIIAALSSLTFTSDKISGGRYHPDPDHRVKDILERLDRPETDYCWGFAFWALITWEQYFDAWLRIWPTTPTNGNFKALFYESLKNLDVLKKEREKK